MDKDFEKWLKQDELFDYYKTNPERQDEIFKDYQREKEYINPENIDEWVKWLCNNPELAEKQYPLTVNNLKERVQNTEPFLSANIIQNLPENFILWKTEIDNHNGKYREKKIKEQITLLNGVLNKWKYPTEIEQQAVESVRPYLVEQLEYWQKELKALPPQQTLNENETVRHTAKHYVLAYLIECNAKGESYPVGQKKELEKIGNKKMGTGKGNRFYKVFNEVVNKDINSEKNLIDIGGENWRTIVKDLSNKPETIETYLQSKQL